MSRFIESIKLADGQFYLLPLHERRMNQTRKACLGLNTPISLVFLNKLAHNYPSGLFKCRILYSTTIEEITILPYQPRPVQSLKIVEGTVDYKYKWENRTAINALFAQKGSCDDVLIIKDGFVTDASYSTVAFFDGIRWLTPSTPLLNGIQRQFLLQTGIIQEAVIRKKDIFKFKRVKLFNAMMDWGIAPEIKITALSG